MSGVLGKKVGGRGEGRIAGRQQALGCRMVGISVSAAQTLAGGSADDLASPDRGLRVRNFL